MMRKRLAFGSLLALLLLLVLALPVAAQDGGPGRLVLGGSYTLESGQTMNGDLAVLGGQATVEEGATVDGDVLVLGGSLDVAGRVNGDIAVFGGSVALASTAYVDGDVVSFGGSVRRADGATVTGQERQGGPGEIPFWGGVPFVPGVVTPEGPQVMSFQQSPGQWVISLILRFVRAVAMTLALAALALVVALFWPKGVERIGQTVLEQPLLSFAVGLLTWVLGIAAVVISAITICLIPVAILLSLVLVVAGLLAWIAAGWVVGRKLLAVLNMRNATTVVEATLGTLLLALIYFLVSSLPCVDFIFGAAVASFGLGAIVLTRFGTRPYVPAVRAVAPVAPTPTTPPAVVPVVDDRSVQAAPRAVDVPQIEDPTKPGEKGGGI